MIIQYFLCTYFKSLADVISPCNVNSRQRHRLFKCECLLMASVLFRRRGLSGVEQGKNMAAK